MHTQQKAQRIAIPFSGGKWQLVNVVSHGENCYNELPYRGRKTVEIPVVTCVTVI